MAEAAYEEHRRQLAGELVDRIKRIAPDVFERLLLHVVVAMGYGGSCEQAAQAVGRGGDQGVDGVINQDPLGLDRVYVQAKRWDGPVGSEPVRNFVGSLAGHHASKGVFITTSHFTDAAWRFVETVPYRVVLIDGETMAQLMVRHGVGVTEVARYPIYRIDTDFFEQL